MMNIKTALLFVLRLTEILYVFFLDSKNVSVESSFQDALVFTFEKYLLKKDVNLDVISSGFDGSPCGNFIIFHELFVKLVYNLFL